MGGPGSGRRQYATTPRTDQSLQIDADNITDGVDHPGATGRKRWGEDKADLTIHFENDDDDTDRVTHLRLEYSVADNWSEATAGEESHFVGVDYTDCNFGGVRPWFRCPGVTDGEACDRRVRKLYLPRGAKYWLCRECYQLQYLTSRCSGDDIRMAELRYKRAFRKADAKGRRPHPNSFPSTPERPTGMHSETFEALTAEVRAARDEWEEEFNKKIRELSRHYSDLTLGD